MIRLLALGKIPVGHAIIDAGITPYQMPQFARRLVCLCDYLGFKLVTKNRKSLETFYPPERWTLPGRDPVKEYEALAEYLNTYSNRTIRNIFWSANNYALLLESLRVLKKGGVFVLHDSMKPQMYGDMIAFVEKLDGI